MICTFHETSCYHKIIPEDKSLGEEQSVVPNQVQSLYTKPLRINKKRTIDSKYEISTKDNLRENYCWLNTWKWDSGPSYFFCKNNLSSMLLKLSCHTHKCTRQVLKLYWLRVCIMTCQVFKLLRTIKRVVSFVQTSNVFSIFDWYILRSASGSHLSHKTWA